MLGFTAILFSSGTIVFKENPLTITKEIIIIIKGRNKEDEQNNFKM